MKSIVFVLASIFILPCFAGSADYRTTPSNGYFVSSPSSSSSLSVKPRKKKRKRSKGHGPKKKRSRKSKSHSHNAVYKRKGNGIL